MALDSLVDTLVRVQPTTPVQTNDLARRFVVGQTLKGVVLRALPEGQTLVNFAGQHVVLEFPRAMTPGQTFLATVHHTTPTLVLKVLGEPGAPEANRLAAQTAQLPQGRGLEPAGALDAIHLKSYLMAKQPFGDMVEALQQQVVHHPTLRALAPALIHRFEETLGALLPPETTLPDASGLQEQVERSGITYEPRVAEVVTKQATPAAREALTYDLKGQLLELLATLDQARQQGDDVGEPRQLLQQALRNIEWQQLSNLFAHQEHRSLLLQFLHPAFPTAHTARLYFRVDPRDQGSHQEDAHDYTLVFLLAFTALGNIRIDATVHDAQVSGTIKTTDAAVADFIAAQTPTLTARLQALGFQSRLRCYAEEDVPLEIEDAFTRLLLADPSRLVDIKT